MSAAFCSTTDRHFQIMAEAALQEMKQIRQSLRGVHDNPGTLRCRCSREDALRVVPCRYFSSGKCKDAANCDYCHICRALNPKRYTGHRHQKEEHEKTMAHRIVQGWNELPVLSGEPCIGLVPEGCYAELHLSDSKDCCEIGFKCNKPRLPCLQEFLDEATGSRFILEPCGMWRKDVHSFVLMQDFAPKSTSGCILRFKVFGATRYDFAEKYIYSDIHPVKCLLMCKLAQSHFVDTMTRLTFLKAAAKTLCKRKHDHHIVYHFRLACTACARDLILDSANLKRSPHELVCHLQVAAKLFLGVQLESPQQLPEVMTDFQRYIKSSTELGLQELDNAESALAKRSELQESIHQGHWHT